MAQDRDNRSVSAITVFLDRDGVICYNRPDHVKSWSEFRFIPGALEAVVELSKADCRIIVVTNQAVINRGTMTQNEVEGINRKMVEAVEQAGGRIEMVLFCPHCPEEGCECRKPGIGMIRAALRELEADNIAQAPRVYLVGDHWTDMQAGLSAGCRTVLVLSGRGLRTLLSHHGRNQKGYIVSRSLKHAVKYILRPEEQWTHNVAKRAWHALGFATGRVGSQRLPNAAPGASRAEDASLTAATARIGTVDSLQRPKLEVAPKS